MSESEERPVGTVVHEEEHESRVGNVVVQYRKEERRRVVIEVSEKELNVAQYCGILIQHPIEDRLIYWGPWRDVEDWGGATCCIVTKNTEPDLRSGSTPVYDHDEAADIEFQLASVNASNSEGTP